MTTLRIPHVFSISPHSHRVGSQVYSLYIFDRHCNPIYFQDWTHLHFNLPAPDASASSASAAADGVGGEAGTPTTSAFQSISTSLRNAAARAGSVAPGRTPSQQLPQTPLQQQQQQQATQRGAPAAAAAAGSEASHAQAQRGAAAAGPGGADGPPAILPNVTRMPGRPGVGAGAGRAPGTPGARQSVHSQAQMQAGRSVANGSILNGGSGGAAAAAAVLVQG